MRLYSIFIKRILDFIFSLLMLVLLSPILIIVSILVKIKIGSPIIFTQQRPGKNEKIFKLCKFRTMTNATDDSGELLPDADRLTSFGVFLRKTSLDEIPELINILKGDMSFVGPRPLLVRYLPAYTEEEHHRHDVRPGLTGLAQVNGRNYVPWDERLAYDVEYVRNISFINDLKIVFKTIKMVLKRDGVAVDPESIDEGYLDEIRANL